MESPMRECCHQGEDRVPTATGESEIRDRQKTELRKDVYPRTAEF